MLPKANKTEKAGRKRCWQKSAWACRNMGKVRTPFVTLGAHIMELTDMDLTVFNMTEEAKDKI